MKISLKEKLLFTFASLIFAGTANSQNINNYIQPVEETYNKKGITWSKNRVFPLFASPEKILDGLYVADKNIKHSEKIMWLTLQGNINREIARASCRERVVRLV